MAELLFSEIVEEAQFAVNDVLGSDAKFASPTVLGRQMTKGANRIMPALPEEMLDDDVLGYVPISLSNEPPVRSDSDTNDLIEGQVTLPEDLNAINTISVLRPHEQVFIHPSYATFRGVISKMPTRIDNMDEWHFCKQGSQLLYWPIPASAPKVAQLSYVKKVLNPSDTNGYFRIPENAVRPVVLNTVAWFKLADLKPDQYQMLQVQASRELITLIGVERLRRVLRDVNVSQKFIDLLLGQIQL